MQQGVEVHAISHLGGLLDRSPDQGLQVPSNDTPCLVCALSAGGSNVIGSDIAAAQSVASTADALRVTVASPASSLPNYYRSRAPPTLL
jgi:hypothetical protein